MPDFAFIDTHVHLWQRDQLQRSWLAGDATLDQDYGLAEFTQTTSTQAVEAFVFVETDVDPAQALAEASWVVDLAREDKRLQGIVAAAPLELGAGATQHLQALTALGPLIKGVRRIVQGEALGFCLSPALLEGVQLLADYDFSFDICIRHEQLPEVIQLVERCPQVRFILDHLGKPAIARGEREPWRKQLNELARRPNVACKISGVVTEANHSTWKPGDIKPYIHDALDAFGEERVLFGGDWPVMLLASSYTRWIETLDALTAELSPTARERLWRANARHWYRLEA